PRLLKRRHSAAWWLAIGSVLLIYTRPFEGGLLLVVVFGALLVNRISWRNWAVIALVAAIGAGWLGYYNSTVTGSAFNLPYLAYDRQYPSTPHLNLLPLPPPHQFAHVDFTVMDRWERDEWAKARTTGFVMTRLARVYDMFDLFLGSFLLLLPA